MAVPVAGVGDRAAGELAGGVQHVVREDGTGRFDVPGGGIDDDRRATAAHAHPAVDEERQRVLDPTLAVEQLDTREQSIEVVHRCSPSGAYVMRPDYP